MARNQNGQALRIIESEGDVSLELKLKESAERMTIPGGISNKPRFKGAEVGSLSTIGEKASDGRVKAIGLSVDETFMRQITKNGSELDKVRNEHDRIEGHRENMGDLDRAIPMFRTDCVFQAAGNPTT
jgi:hypothetical protein